MTALSTDRIGEFVHRVEREVGAGVTSTDPVRRERLSTDWAHMSPILQAQLPAGLADVVVTPRRADEIAAVVALAYELAIPVTARGTGLGNYGQAIPLHGGVLIDVSECRRVLRIDDDTVTAEAGVRMRDLEDLTRRHGHELLMFPSTKGSTLGGFLAGGSGGTGSLRYGTNADGFVRALDVAACNGTTALQHVSGADTVPYVHAYGTTGVIARATVALDGAHDWVGLFSCFDEYPAMIAVLRALSTELTVTPRLVSADEAPIVSALPRDRALDPDRLSLRAIVDAADVPAARELIGALGGTVLDVRAGVRGADRVTSLSFNHTTFHMQRRELGRWFHVEVWGAALADDTDAVRAVYPGTVLHLEATRDNLVAMLMAPYRDAADVYRGMADLQTLGLGIHSPHTWILDRRLDGIRSVLAANDPRGLLNPGKLSQN